MQYFHCLILAIFINGNWGFSMLFSKEILLWKEELIHLQRKNSEIIPELKMRERAYNTILAMTLTRCIFLWLFFGILILILCCFLTAMAASG